MAKMNWDRVSSEGKQRNRGVDSIGGDATWNNFWAIEDDAPLTREERLKIVEHNAKIKGGRWLEDFKRLSGGTKKSNPKTDQ